MYEISIISASLVVAIIVAVYTIILGRLLHRRKNKLSGILVVIICSASVCIACLLREILQILVNAGIVSLGNLALSSVRCAVIVLVMLARSMFTRGLLIQLSLTGEKACLEGRFRLSLRTRW